MKRREAEAKKKFFLMLSLFCTAALPEWLGKSRTVESAVSLTPYRKRKSVPNLLSDLLPDLLGPCLFFSEKNFKRR